MSKVYILDGVTVTVEGTCKATLDRIPIVARKVDILYKNDLLSFPSIAIINRDSEITKTLNRTYVLVMVRLLNTIEVKCSATYRGISTPSTVVKLSNTPNVCMSVVTVIKESTVVKYYLLKVARKCVESAEGAVVEYEGCTVGLVNVESIDTVTCESTIFKCRCTTIRI